MQSTARACRQAAERRIPRNVVSMATEDRGSSRGTLLGRSRASSNASLASQPPSEPRGRVSTAPPRQHAALDQRERSQSFAGKARDDAYLSSERSKSSAGKVPDKPSLTLEPRQPRDRERPRAPSAARYAQSVAGYCVAR